jgi:UDP-glucose 4-epimerase
MITLFAYPSAVGQVFNLGSDQEVSINDLAHRVIALANSSSAVQHIPYDQAYGKSFDDLPRRVPNLQRIHSAIGFAPKVNLDQIIRSVIDDYRGNK